MVGDCSLQLGNQRIGQDKARATLVSLNSLTPRPDSRRGFHPLCPAERGRFAGGSPVALSERSEFSDRPGGPSAARVARRAGAAGSASLPTFLREQESRSPAGASPGAALRAVPAKVGADATANASSRGQRIPAANPRQSFFHGVPRHFRVVVALQIDPALRIGAEKRG